MMYRKWYYAHTHGFASVCLKKKTADVVTHYSRNDDKETKSTALDSLQLVVLVVMETIIAIVNTTTITIRMMLQKIQEPQHEC